VHPIANNSTHPSGRNNDAAKVHPTSEGLYVHPMKQKRFMGTPVRGDPEGRGTRVQTGAPCVILTVSP
jgi:hypothetical protein